MFWIGLIIGLWIGTPAGFVIMAILTIGKDD